MVQTTAVKQLPIAPRRSRTCSPSRSWIWQIAAMLFRLAPGETFTFFSGGVVEAQSPTGELSGFERTGSVSRQSVQQIADVAQAFGQEDDITALTLQFAPALTLK
jgi:Stage II sporulation protein E (SpoIIE)